MIIHSLLILLFVLSLCFPVVSHSQTMQTATNPAHEKVVLQLKWKHQFQFAGYYAAQKQGYFAEQGLDVEIRERDISRNNILQVLNGEADYGIADSVAFLYQSRGEPLLIVAPIFQHSPQSLITLKSSGIDSPYKLKDKQIAFYQKDTDGFSILAMLKELDIPGNLDRIRTNITPGMLVRGEVDAFSGYVTNEPFYFHQQGIEINLIHPMNFGIDLYGDMLITTQKEQEQHPERVEKMRQAVLKGWHYALNHQQEIAQYILDTYQPKEKTLEHLLYEAQSIEETIGAKSTPLGTLNHGRVEFIQNLLRKHNLIENDWDISQGIYQNQTHRFNFTQKELDWIADNPVIKLGIDSKWHPIDYVDNKGHFSGISSEIFSFIEQSTGLEFAVQTQYNWAQTVDRAKQNQIDVLSALVISEERREYLNFTQPYLKFPTVIATLASEPYISDLKRLNTMTLGVVKGYVAYEFLKTNFPETKLKLVESPEKGLEAVSKGFVDGYVDNVAVIGHHIRNNGLTNVQIGGELPFSRSISIGVRKDWPMLTQILNKSIAQISPEKMNEIQNKYLTVTYQNKTDWGLVLSILIPIITITLIILGLYIKLSRTQKTLEEKNAALKMLSTTDHLTGLFNRGFTDKTLNAELSRAKRYFTPLSILMVDLDYFKNINDTHGHDIGDQVLQTLTQQLKNSLRESDVIGRWGGEEFLIICPNTNQQQSIQLSEKIHQTIRQTQFVLDIKITVSIGAASYQANESEIQLVKRADIALYDAKKLGRNRTQIAP